MKVPQVANHKTGSAPIAAGGLIMNLGAVCGKSAASFGRGPIVAPKLERKAVDARWRLA
jgi:hypothetical protein